MKNCITVMIAVLLLLALPLAVFAGGQGEQGEQVEQGEQAAEKDPIKLGGVWPLADITGDQGSKAAQLAVEEINANGGVLGRQLELSVIDSELKPEKGRSAIERLATVEDVDIFVGGMSSGVHLGQIPSLKKYEKVTMWTGAASSKAEEAVGPDADWYFHLHPWDYTQGQSYVDGWGDISEKYPEIKVSDWFLAYEDGAFGTGSFQASQNLYTELGEMTGESFKSAATGGGDYTAVLEHAKEYGPEVFIWAGYDADALPMLETAKAIDFAPPIYLGAPPGWPQGFGESPLSNYVMLYGMWAPSMNSVSGVSKHFYEAYTGKYDGEPQTYFAPLSYSAIYILKEGIERAGTLEKEALIEALENTEYDSPLGQTIGFSPSNIIQHQGIWGQKILQWQNGKREVIWPFEYQTAEPVYPFPGWDER
ncbi:MAG: ABC transporter substrate-binding protein [Spirochaetales bacterium]|nr:ABC transporter substrate-binding protein [Spirochaetales bacterium]MCF7939226.1 ABC transporter substrate-binding protein [Spirochaetales bacterium]